VRPETTLIWFIFFIKALGWEQLAQANPDISTTSSDLAPTNFILKFFLSAFIFLCIMATQAIVEVLNGYFFSLKFQDFMDLCSVSNISLLIMDQHFHGYYLHGQAPWVSSDLLMSELKEKLDMEEMGQQRSRGLIPTLPNQGQNEVQSYEIYFPASVR
jgi:meckelin